MQPTKQEQGKHDHKGGSCSTNAPKTSGSCGTEAKKGEQMSSGSCSTGDKGKKGGSCS
jgi:hypothetical protein